MLKNHRALLFEKCVVKSQNWKDASKKKIAPVVNTALDGSTYPCKSIKNAAGYHPWPVTPPTVDGTHLILRKAWCLSAAGNSTFK